MKTFKINKGNPNIKNWPFTVDSVRIEKNKKTPAIYVKCNSKTYGLNGIDRNCKSLSEIWLDNPEIPGTKISITSIFNLCKHKGLL